MIYVQIHDDNLPGAMKDMIHYINHGSDVTQDELYDVAKEQTEELLYNWNYYKKNPDVVRRFYGD